MPIQVSPSPTPSSLEVLLEQIHKDLTVVARSHSSTGNHYVAITSIFVTTFLGIITFLLLWKQYKTMESQRKIMRSQSKITSKLVDIERDRDKQENFVSSYLEMKVNESKFVTSVNGGMVPYDEIYSYTLHCVNSSQLPVSVNTIVLRYPIYEESDLEINQPGMASGSEDPKIFNPKPVTFGHYVLKFSTIPPNKTVSFEVDSKSLAKNSRIRKLTFRTVDDAYLFLGVADGEFQIFHSFIDAKGKICMRKIGGYHADFADAEALEPYVFPSNSEIMRGRWLTHEN